MPAVRSKPTLFLHRGRPSTSSIRRSPRGLPTAANDPYAPLALFERNIKEDDPLQRSFLLRHLAASYLTRADWATLMAFAVTTSSATRQVQEEVRRRIRLFLRPFMLEDEMDIFFKLLMESKGLLIGRTVRNVIQMNSQKAKEFGGALGDKDKLPLQVLVPKGESGVFIERLRGLGYSIDKEAEAKYSGPFGGGVESSTILVAYGKRELGPLPAMISVHDCGRGAIEGLLNGPLTIDMNAIGPDCIYSFFPRAVYKNEGLHSDAQRYRHSLGSRRRDESSSGTEVSTSNRAWSRPCGLECPGRERSIRTDEGIGIFRWKSCNQALYACRSEDEYLQQDHIVLKFLSKCYNLRCDNWSPVNTLRE